MIIVKAVQCADQFDGARLISIVWQVFARSGMAVFVVQRESLC